MLVIEKLSVKDEVLSDVPKFRVKDSSGNIIHDNCTIEMITSILTTGTNINKVLFDKVDTNFENVRSMLQPLNDYIVNKTKGDDYYNMIVNGILDGKPIPDLIDE